MKKQVEELRNEAKNDRTINSKIDFLLRDRVESRISKNCKD